MYRFFDLSLAIALVIVMCIGCCTVENENEDEKELFISGVVRDVSFVNEDSSNCYVIIKFDDRIVKLRSNYQDLIDIPLNKQIVIYYYDSKFIQKVTTVGGLPLLPYKE